MAKASRLAWLKNFPGKYIFAIIAGLVLFNFVIVVMITIYSKDLAQEADTDEVISQIVNTVYLLQISPKTEWDRIATVSKTSEFDVHFSTTPQSEIQLSSNALWKINPLVQNVHKDIIISVHLADNLWVNFHVQPRSRFPAIEVSVIILEAAVAFALFFAAWSMYRFTGPLKNFKKVAEQLGIKLHAEPLVEYGPAIVRETADAMNQMQTRIRDLLQDRNLMLAAISHDLRTPLTRLKLTTQFLENQEQSHCMTSDLDEMEEMIDQILSYSRDASNQEDEVDLDLATLILAICDEKCEQGHDVECDLQVQRIPIKGRRLALKRAFSNFINNAIKYAEHVLVTVKDDAEHFFVLIEDDGPGIPEEQLEKVFTPFYRVDKSRNAMTGGTGLGLAIAQDVLHAHQAGIRLENRLEGGLRVVVAFEYETTETGEK